MRHFPTFLCAAVAGLVALGLVMLASTSAWVRGVEAPYHFLVRQAVMVGVGLVFAVVAAKVPLGWYRKLSALGFVVACVLLALCFVPGINVEIFGSKRWIQLGPLPQFQPSEMAKIVVVLCLATWFARWQTEVHTFWRGFVIPGLIAAVPVGLIAAETDVGTALSLSVAVGAIMFCVGTRLRYLVPTALLAMSGAAWYIVNNENRWSRIEAWLDLENPVHQLDKGMQQWRALLALGNGGPHGVGLGNGVEKFGTLTFAHIDFIFPVIGEELGLFATLAVVAAYVIIAISGCGIALAAATLFNRVLALGLTCCIVVPAMVNIGVTTAVLPNDGLPLPFVSYGGTSLVFSLAAVGMLVGIHRSVHSKKPVEFPLSRETRLAVKL
ncbi:MAG: FtsW/RodA/SpoVE family cell cycle protein [Verrucomicrobiota bacterium JB025]|nr:putative peptidoglycan glycosyltransferase FtsW [Verrucomicrobiota bacterium JB025]